MRRAGALLLAAAFALGGADAASSQVRGTALIQHSVEVDANGARFERWVDLQTGRTRLVQGKAGHPVREVAARIVGGQIVERVLDYRLQTVSTLKFDKPMISAAAVSDPGDEYRSGVRRGMYRVIGRTAHTLHLRMLVTFPKGSEKTDVWVDRVTYRPLEKRWRSVGGRLTSDTTYEWLPRTSANLARLAVVVPPHFVGG